ncbi:MAG: ABC transporter permease/substrate-binding protein [Candidatus Cyclobacteriaceae bacterium M3_2C_046]
MEFINNFYQFLISHLDDLQEQVMEHIGLTLAALFFAIILGILTGIFISRFVKWSSPILGLVNVIQTIPSIALLGFLLPLLGIGALPAIIALFLYALLPIVRNTYAGITQVDAAILEAARGMGLNNRQILKRIEIPLALPVIFAGIRTAVVISIGVATLCALIAAGGLGEFIFRGIALNNIYMILAGAIPAALLAIIFDAFLGLIQHNIHKTLKPLIVGTGLIIILIPLYFWFNTDSQDFVAGFPSEFIEREDGFVGLKEHYNLDLDTREMEISLMYQALKNGKVDVISGFSTDGRIEAYQLKPLADDKNYFPPYQAAPLAREELLNKYPELKEIFSQLHQQISDQEMIRMNYRVDHDKISPYQVAREFLQSEGIRNNVRRQAEGDILIGSKNFTESFILAEMFAILIENYTSLDAELKLGFGGTKIIFDALRTGEIDMYPEYTGTGFLVLLQPPEPVKQKYMRQEDQLLNYLRTEFRQQFDLVWLPVLGFNNTFALMMREKQAEQLHIQSISDLARYLEE